MDKPYIVSLWLTNFQSHANTTVALAPSGEMTIITGASDSGKTSIIRALRWLAYNTPSGSDFIRVGTEFVRVVATMSDGTVVVRERRAKGLNQYRITRGNDCQTYEGFGANPPLEVQQALQMAPVAVGDMTINLNLSEQLDGPFLGRSISAGARAKTLGRIAGAEIIDQAGRGAGTDVGRRTKDLAAITGMMGDNLQAINEYRWLEPAARGLEAAQEAHSEALRLEGVRDRLAGLQARLGAQREARVAAAWVLNGLQWVDFLEAALPVAVGWAGSARRLYGAVWACRDHALQHTKAWADKLEADRVLALAPVVTKLEESARICSALRRLSAREEANLLNWALTKEALGEANRVLDYESNVVTAASQLSCRARMAVLLANQQRVSISTHYAEATLRDWVGLQMATDCTTLAADLLPRASRLRANQFQWAEAKSRGLVAQQTATRLAGLEEAVDLLAKAQTHRTHAAALNAKCTDLNMSRRRALNTQSALKIATTIYSTAQTDLAELLASLGTCPTCGHPLMTVKLHQHNDKEAI